MINNDNADNETEECAQLYSDLSAPLWCKTSCCSSFVLGCSTEQVRDIQVDIPNFGKIQSCIAK